ncbi:Alpha-1,2-mannosyltransferase, family GT22 [Ectocarpus siliculosus]|uniref:Mannosyltransferase n=1 Tax=Ectocarpus siliculosus TaxID=2880 RepID=D7FX48_ECTSI|nr:Alpha-1,2-mannosyltransferase, family GT22 [Ectocarpus siliculosus]|eukprot:CBJ26381.1 Alpha-1,2-mannosyltransferase, family GT22 [Ectocarpus siliculosus]
MGAAWDRRQLRPVLGAKLLTVLVAFRVFNALVVRTSFTPDEFWQGPEPAHLLAFGSGHLTWEWEQTARIRGFTHPLIFAAVYKALQILGLDTRWAVAHSPKLLQGVMAGVCDYCAFGLALRAFGAAAAGWALLFQVLSWFNFYCLVRPYSNSAEAVLATAALFQWAPHILSACRKSARGDAVGRRDSAGTRGETCALLLAALCVAVRPTSAALWAVTGMFRLSTLPIKRWPRYLALTVLPPVATVVGASFYLDSKLYGTATLVPLNFLRFNVLEGKSRIFGEQPWHWNFSQGLPAVLGAALPPALWGLWRPSGEGGVGGGAGSGDRRRLGWLALWFLAYHSTSPHKEFRFLLPVLPIAHAYAGQAVSAFLATPATTAGPLAASNRQRQGLPPQGRRRRLGTAIAVALFVLHVPAAVYLSVWHQGGALAAVDAVAERVPAVVASKIAAAAAGDGWEAGGAPRLGKGGDDGDAPSEVAVHFLMPCHSAPLHSHLHFRGSEGGLWSGKPSLWSLDCSPKNRELPGGSESDKFQADPLAFLQSTYGLLVSGEEQDDDDDHEVTNAVVSPPDLAVMYDTHLARPGVAEYLSGRLGLVPTEVLFHAHVNGDADSDDTHRNVHVLERGVRRRFGAVEGTTSFEAGRDEM